jgi:hypothetical protein
MMLSAASRGKSGFVLALPGQKKVTKQHERLLYLCAAFLLMPCLIRAFCCEYVCWVCWLVLLQKGLRLYYACVMLVLYLRHACIMLAAAG